MAQSHIKQLILSWLRMVHRKVIETKIGNAMRSLSVYHVLRLSIFLLHHIHLYFNKFLPPVSSRILICWMAI